MWVLWLVGGLIGLVLLGAGALCLYIVRLVNRSMVDSVTRMAEPDGLLKLIDNGPRILLEGEEFHEQAVWAMEQDYTPELVADFSGTADQTITVGVWRNRRSRTYLCSYSTPQKVCSEFVTQLERDAALTTSNTKDSMTMPAAPGRYVQAFDGAGIEALFRRHEEAAAWLMQHKGLAPVERPESTDVLILESVRNQMAYVKTLFLWRHRGFWWYFIRRSRLNNKSIAERYRA